MTGNIKRGILWPKSVGLFIMYYTEMIIKISVQFNVLATLMKVSMYVNLDNFLGFFKDIMHNYIHDGWP